MQNTLSLVKDVRGCMTRFDPLTPEIVADQTEDGLTYDELKEVLEQCGMNIEKVVFDGSRAFQNAFYDVFMALQEIPWLMKLHNYPEAKMLTVEENMARALSIKWSEYDLAKAVSY